MRDQSGGPTSARSAWRRGRRACAKCCSLIPRAEASALRAQGEGDDVNHRQVQQRVFRSAHRVRPSFRSTTVTPGRSCAASLRHEPPSETGCDRARRTSVTRSVLTATPDRVRLHPAGWPAAGYRRRSCTCCGGGRAWHRSRRRCANEAARCRSDTEGDRRRSLVTGRWYGPSPSGAGQIE